jgi:hypothetical protein
MVVICSQTNDMKFARWVYLIAGIYGLIILMPQYFLERSTSANYPPPIAHPEYYYGFIGVAVAWQVAFLTIARDPIRFRPLMIPAVLEKILFAVAVFALYANGRVATPMTLAAAIDLTLGVLFSIAYIRTASATR